jgi:hypothetical protein
MIPGYGAHLPTYGKRLSWYGKRFHIHVKASLDMMNILNNMVKVSLDIKVSLNML